MTGLYDLSAYSSLLSTRNSSFMPSFYSNLTEYSNIRNGIAIKAAKAYYKKVGTLENDTTTKRKDEDTKAEEKRSTINGKLDKAYKALSTSKAKASELVNGSKKLLSTDKGSLFAEDKQDMKAIYQAVSDFASDYNDTIDALGSTMNPSVTSAGNSMKRMTDIMKNSLAKVGVTVGEDGKLAVNKEVFEAAAPDKVKTMFHGKGSYADIVSSSASRIATMAENQINQTSGSLYASNGHFSSFNSSLFFNGYI